MTELASGSGAGQQRGDQPATPPNGRPRVAVVFGGTSSEHGVSCLTAAGVLSAIDRDRYDVVGIGITPSGRWVLVEPQVLDQLGVVDGRLPQLTEEALDAVLLRAETGTSVARRESAELSAIGHLDVAFSLLHGPFGEDGTIQGLFEMMGTRYVGAGVLASAVGMDKHFMKMVLAASGLPVGAFTVIRPQDWVRDRVACLDAANSLHYPLYVKPARGGSSMGITRVEDVSKLEAAVEYAQGFDPKVIVEAGFTDAREVECGVLESLDGGPPDTSEVAEIRVHTESGFYDFEAKYLPEEQVDLDVPADIEPEIAAEVQDLARRTFEAIGCEGLARVDVFVTHDNRVVVNEINTMPGFTEHSMFPRMWAHSGLPYPQLVDRLIQLALRRPVGLR
ncbi:D-alanine--D-alanine ligase family protein [Microlunatus panaciterrae]|uniref:D-alanine--D-alanine ligase n=1 Tax=Microlunatus panaciterrae TaxID=400768 RepID=A0ABS2RNK7_9ACTN|nr:D-alanine--D-alanine ligase family protein [Microlunatus panaciterrae]MBM7800567.1 D-alanine-D-alanine ligase [Microlunatus panaciterrae]